MDYREIVSLMNDPSGLERLYGQDRAGFEEALPDALAARSNSLVLLAWAERLLAEPTADNAPSQASSPAPSLEVTTRDWLPWLVWGGICGVLMLVAVSLSMSHSMGRVNGAGLMAFLSTIPTAVYCLLVLRWRGWPRNRTALVLGLLVLVFGYSYWMNLHTSYEKWMLADRHFQGALFFVFGLCFVGEQWLGIEDWKGYVRFAGDAFGFFLIALGPLVLLGVIGAALYPSFRGQDMVAAFQGGLVAGVMSMFVTTWAALHFRSWGLASRIFQLLTPVVLLLLIGSVIASAGSGYRFNSLGVSRIFMVVIFAVLCLSIFTVVGLARKRNRFIEYSLLAMVVLTLLLGAPRLAKVLQASFGHRPTPIDLEIIGITLLWYCHLAAITVGLLLKWGRRISMATVESITVFTLPVYCAWLLFMAFVMPWVL